MEIKCPECGSKMFVDPDAQIGETVVPTYTKAVPRDRLPVRWRTAPVGFCSGCEFSIEITHG